MLQQTYESTHSLCQRLLSAVIREARFPINVSANIVETAIPPTEEQI